jgi:hypothetical protein
MGFDPGNGLFSFVLFIAVKRVSLVIICLAGGDRVDFQIAALNLANYPVLTGGI